jgi:hypothetical protein
LHEQNAVVHDIKMVGSSDVAHQIDVRMERAGEPVRTLIECKDYDVRGASVGLSVIRDFRSVVEDTGADEAIVITCNGFTRHACKYAKAKDIKLVVLRTFDEEDMDGRVQKIIVNILIAGVFDIVVDNMALQQSEHSKLDQELKAVGAGPGIQRDDPVYFVNGEQRVQFIKWLHDEADRLAKRKPAGTWVSRIWPQGWAIQVAQNQPIAFDYLDLRFSSGSTGETLEVTSDRVAELLLSGFGDADIIIFGDQLERRQISVKGQVI